MGEIAIGELPTNEPECRSNPVVYHFTLGTLDIRESYNMLYRVAYKRRTSGLRFSGSESILANYNSCVTAHRKHISFAGSNLGARTKVPDDDEKRTPLLFHDGSILDARTKCIDDDENASPQMLQIRVHSDSYQYLLPFLG